MKARKGAKDRPGKAGTSIANPEEIERLVRLMEANSLLELEVQSSRGKIKLVRYNHATGGGSGQSARQVDEGRDAAAKAPQPGAIAVTAPMVGTFHRSLDPGKGPLVEVGDIVNQGDVLGVIEAMKMMNEIEAECRGRVKQVLLDDGRPVEYGQPLFLIEPL